MTAMKRGLPRVLTALALAITCLVAAPATIGAWGAQGHRLVAAIALERLTATARANVDWLIGPQRLPDVASWADQYLPGNYQTFFWHFVNIPPDARSYDRNRDCPRQPGVDADTAADKWRDCVVDRIRYHEERLANAALDRADRAIALKFLVHFVGDLHQPYHALGVERGGNGVLVSIFGRENCANDPARSSPCNLHSVWDSALVEHRRLDDAAYVEALDRLIRKNGWSTDIPGTAAQWAMESHAIAKAALVPQRDRVGEAYYRAHIGEVDRRLAQGGVRLAAVLNRSLATRPPR